MQDREQEAATRTDPAGDGTVVGEDSAVGGTPTSGAHGDTGADVGALSDVVGGASGGGEVPVDGATVGEGADVEELEQLRDELAERTADLQRVSAEYANYRRRIDRERESTVSGAKAQIAAELLLVLDDVDRAAAHGDLTGGFKVVADRLGETLGRAGLTSFGAEGDPFDPSVHEAVAHETSTRVTGPTVTTVMRRGYRFGDRVLRPAMVAVTDADPDAPHAPVANAGAGVGSTASPSATDPDAV